MYEEITLQARTVVTELLEQGGIRVIHDRSLHDYPSYNDAYGSSRTGMKEYLERYPSIRLALTGYSQQRRK